MSEHLGSKRILLQVNGEEQTCSTATSLPQFLEQLGMNPRLVAVEYNGEILHRQFWEETLLEEGDCLEVVTIVGGGAGTDRSADSGSDPGSDLGSDDGQA